MGDLSEYMTTREAADELGVTKARVDQLCKAGRLKFVMKGNARLLPRADVEAFARLDRPAGRPGRSAGAGPKPRRKGK